MRRIVFYVAAAFGFAATLLIIAVKERDTYLHDMGDLD